MAERGRVLFSNGASVTSRVELISSTHYWTRIRRVINTLTTAVLILCMELVGSWWLPPTRPATGAPLTHSQPNTALLRQLRDTSKYLQFQHTFL